MKPYYTLADLLDEGHPFDAGESVPAKLAVIGFPIAHSKSPAMQQAALDAAGIRARYIRIQASPEEFGEVVRLLRERGFTGANVTVPHKQAACSLCNDTDALSRVTGSVNTLVFQKDGSVSGLQESLCHRNWWIFLMRTTKWSGVCITAAGQMCCMHC